MHLLTVVLLLLAGATPWQWAVAITGGEPDGTRHPNVGAIVVRSLDPANPWRLKLCSGTLIDRTLFLTAGHCAAIILNQIANGGGQLEQVVVSFDSENVFAPATWIPIRAVLLHPDFDEHHVSGSGSYNDIGALVLGEPVTDITPATLAPAGYLDQLKDSGQLQGGVQQAEFTVVGYGSFLEWPPPQIILPNRTRYVAQSGFLAFDDSWLFLSQNQALGLGGVGYGDSGGPTFWKDKETGQEILVSVTSWADPDLVAAGISYRIDTTDSLFWIEQWRTALRR